MFNYHFLIPWDHFRVNKKKSGDHFGVDLGIICALEIISGSGSFRGLYSSVELGLLRKEFDKKKLLLARRVYLFIFYFK